MKKSQIIFLILGIILVSVLFSLPTVVVDNSQDDVVMDESGSVSTAPSFSDNHENALSAAAREQVDQLKAQLESEEDREKYTILADSIGKVYQSSGKLDSAAYFYGLLADKFADVEHLEKAGNAYYEAYGFSMTPEKTSYLANKTREYLGQVLENDPSRLDLKTKIAMTHVSSTNPMQGITMLREILEEDPTNEMALFNMGVLSMQSGQYKMAAQRFEDLVANHPGNVEGQFYLGVSYYESKQLNKAKTQLQLVKTLTDDPQILAGVDNYLDKL